MYLKSILKKITKILFLQLFSLLFYFEIAVKWSKSRIFENSNWNLPKTPSKMHMYDMLKIDTIVFEIVGGGGGGAFKAPTGSFAV